MLLFAAGLGVPGGFAQAKSASKNSVKKKPTPASTRPATKNASSKKSTVKSNKSKSNSSKAAPARSSASKSGNASTKPGARASAANSNKKSSRRPRKQPGQKAPTSDRINEIQSALARDGSFAGTPTGKWDDDTVAAMRKFQAAHGLNPSGKLDALSLQKLGLGSQTAGVAAPTPPPGATSRLTSSITSPSTQRASLGNQ